MIIAPICATLGVFLSTLAPIATTPDEPFATVESTVKALYEVISGPKEKKRDWDRFFSMFHASAKLGVSVQGSPGAERRIITLTPQTYQANAERLFASEGFFEREVFAKREVFGGVAHVFSTYESRHAESDEKPFDRGINSIQLAHDGKRWWVMSLIWQPETKWLPIPAANLPPNKGPDGHR